MNYYTIVLYKSSIRVDRKYKSQDQDLKWHPMRRKFFSSSETTKLIGKYVSKFRMTRKQRGNLANEHNSR
jgi:hypothetical protein